MRNKDLTIQWKWFKRHSYEISAYNGVTHLSLLKMHEYGNERKRERGGSRQAKQTPASKLNKYWIDGYDYSIK